MEGHATCFISSTILNYYLIRTYVRTYIHTYIHIHTLPFKDMTNMTCTYIRTGPYIKSWMKGAASWHPSVIGHRLRAAHHSYASILKVHR